MLDHLRPRGDGDIVMGDLTEEYYEVCAYAGVRAARRWYWAQVIKSLPAFMAQNLFWSVTMLKSYLTIALRTLRKHSGYAFINVFGLALGMACCLLILMLVRHEWSYDTFHADGDRIYRVLYEETGPDGDLAYQRLIHPRIGPAMAEAFPSITHLARYVQGNLEVQHERERIRERVAEVDSTFFELFSFPFLVGDPATALDDPQNIILTAEAAEKYFSATPVTGYHEVLGQTVTLARGENEWPFTVSAVLAPLPTTSSIQFDLALSFRQYANIRLGANNWGGRNSLYIKLAEDQGPEALEEAFKPFTALHLGDHIDARRNASRIGEGEEAFKMVLQSLRDVHLNPEVGNTYEEATHDPLYSYILSGIALLVLLIACINFMTLSLGRSAGRAREVGMRKVLGAYRSQLMKQFWGEAVLLSLIALVLSLLLAGLALPAFNALTGQTLSFGQFGDALSIGTLVGLVTFIGLVAGGYPAVVLSRFQPVSVLKGNVGTGQRRRFTQGLVVLQYTFSIALIISTLVMYQQLDYLLHKDLGFKGDQIVVVQTNGLSTPQENQVLQVFREELGSYDRVTNVLRTGYSFTKSYDTYGWNAPDGTPMWGHNFGVDHDYIEVLDMKIVAGRTFSRDLPTDSTQSVLVNEAFVREFNIAAPIGYELSGYDGYFGDIDPVIIGVVEDFNFQSLRETVEPAILNMHPDYYMGMNAMLVKIKPEDVPGTLALLETTWKKVFPEKPLVSTFLDADMDAQYQDEQRWSSILTYSALFAILIACLGLFGLATLTVSRRTKEIGIRKVLGASVSGLAVLVAREFAVLVGVATVLAWPLAYFGMTRWLETFAYSIDLGLLVFIVAGLLALGLAVGTVSYHALRAAAADPVKTLRYE